MLYNILWSVAERCSFFSLTIIVQTNIFFSFSACLPTQLDIYLRKNETTLRYGESNNKWFNFKGGSYDEKHNEIFKQIDKSARRKIANVSEIYVQAIYLYTMILIARIKIP